MLPNVFKLLRLSNKIAKNQRLTKLYSTTRRTYLTQAYYNNNAWEDRCNDDILKRVNPDELYHNLDQRYQRDGVISAIDVDIFANSVKDDMYVDELLDVVHKLRLTADTMNTLDSTMHAVVRYLLANNRRNDLLNALDDRLNYGIFLDYYTGNLLMDHYYKEKDFAAGVMVASQFMLQEDMNHPVVKAYALLHCYNYLKNPVGWPEKPKPEEPEDEVKIRVKYLRNPYFDDHFDLTDPVQIVGKILVVATKTTDSLLSNSLHFLGLNLWGKSEQAEKFAKTLKQIHNEVLSLLPAESPALQMIESIEKVDGNVQELLDANMKEVLKVAEADAEEQKKVYKSWEVVRKNALDAHKHKLDIAKRIANIETTKEELRIKEEKLWFFENEEKIELAIEQKFAHLKPREEKTEEVTDTQQKQKTSKKKVIDENYIPPNIN